jgi:DNA end-binding protein Ku
MARSIWKGNVTFGLVTIPVEVRSAETPLKEIDLDLLDSRNHARVHYKRVNEKTGEEVPWKSIVKGFKVGDSYVELSQEDFDEAARDVTKGVEILEFVKRDEISPLFFEKPYFLVPAKGAEKAYVLLRDALEREDCVGIASVVMHQRQHLGALMVVEDALALITMRFGDEVKRPKDLDLPRPKLDKVSITNAEQSMASKLIEGMTVKWQPERHHDEYHRALLGLIKDKSRRHAGKAEPEKKRPAAEVESKEPAADIMELLKQSIEHPRRAARRAAGTRHTRRAPSRRKAG